MRETLISCSLELVKTEFVTATLMFLEFDLFPNMITSVLLVLNTTTELENSNCFVEFIEIGINLREFSLGQS
jgi:hypothetical protein